MGEEELKIGACEREGKSGLGQQARWAKSSESLLVHARQHDEAVHEQQAKATASDPKDQQCDVDLPAHPGAKEEAAQAALAPDASAHAGAPCQAVVDQRAYAITISGLEVIILVLALGGASASRIGRGGAAADVDEWHCRLQFGERALGRVGGACRVHLRVLLVHVGVVRVIERAGAVLAAKVVAVGIRMGW